MKEKIFKSLIRWPSISLFSLAITVISDGYVPRQVGSYGKECIFKCHTIMSNLTESECDGTGVGI